MKSRVMVVGVALMGAYVVATTLLMASLLVAGTRAVFSGPPLATSQTNHPK